MNFLPDLFVPLRAVRRQAYNRQTLEARFKGKSIGDVLEMRVDEALEFFDASPRSLAGSSRCTRPGWATSPSASRHDALRRRGAARQARRRAPRRDRPDPLHPRRADHRPPLRRRRAPARRPAPPGRPGNTVVVIEHNLDVIKTADWLIDLGPEGGTAAAEVVATGPPGGGRGPEQLHRPFPRLHGRAGQAEARRRQASRARRRLTRSQARAGTARGPLRPSPGGPVGHLVPPLHEIPALGVGCERNPAT